MRPTPVPAVVISTDGVLQMSFPLRPIATSQHLLVVPGLPLFHAHCSVEQGRCHHELVKTLRFMGKHGPATLWVMPCCRATAASQQRIRSNLLFLMKNAGTAQPTGNLPSPHKNIRHAPLAREHRAIGVTPPHPCLQRVVSNSGLRCRFVCLHFGEEPPAFGHYGATGSTGKAFGGVSGSRSIAAF